MSQHVIPITNGKGTKELTNGTYNVTGEFTGYDNSYLASTGKVPLTTVTHPQEELGRMAAEMLLTIIRDKDAEESGRQILIEPELVVRESVKKR